MPLIRDLALIAFCGALIAFVGAGSRPLTRSSEGRVARVAQEMLEDGDWVVPHLNGAVRLEKPPFSSWLVAGVAVLAGAPRVEPWHAYLPPGLAAVFLVLLVYLWLRERFPRSAGQGSCVSGMVAALVLAAAPGFVLQARSAELDMLLALWVAVAFCGLWRFRLAGSRAALLVAYAALGLSILTKGHVGLAIVLPSLLLWSVWERAHKALPPARAGSWPWHVAGVALVCCMVLPWGIPFLQQSGMRWEDFSQEGLRRFGEATSHREPWYFYLRDVPGWFLPWFLLLPLALWQTWRLPPDERSPLRRLCWVWFGWSMVLFSALSAKQRHYAIPFFPPLAMLIGDAVARWLEHPEESARARARVALAVFGVVLAAAALAAAAWAAQTGLLKPPYGGPVWCSAALAALFFLTGSVAALKVGRGFSLWWAGCTCLVSVFALTKEQAEAEEGLQEFCRQVRELVPAEAILYDFDVALPRREGAGRNVWRAQVLYYVQRKVAPVDEELSALLGKGSSADPVYALVTQKRLEGAPAERYEALVRAERFLGHRYSVFLIKARGK